MNRLILRESIEDAPPTISGRTLTTRIATYGRTYNIGPHLERIRRGAFKDAMSRPRGALRWRHHGERPGDDDTLENFYGVMTALREEGDQVIADFEVFPGPREDKLLRLVSSETITGVSMAAVVRESQKINTPAGPVIEITRIGHLDGVSITPSPAYDDAKVMAIREATRAAVDAERAFWASLTSSGRSAPSAT